MDYIKQMMLIQTIFQKELYLEIYDLKLNYNESFERREVVRGVYVKDGKILVVHPKDEMIYGLPGGGIEEGESHVDALSREMREEVGATKIEIIKYIGQMISHRKKYDSEKRFIPTHHLYRIDILEQGKQELIDYEKNIGLHAVYMEIDDVIKANEIALQKREQDYLDFYTNQTVLLKILRDYYLS